MDRDALLEYVGRDRSAVARLKRAYWARRFQEEGPEAIIRASRALYEHVRSVRPDYPTARDRADDLAHHVELKRKLDQASRALAVR